jgi:glycerate 2-kinase
VRTFIANTDALGTTELRRDALRIIEAGLSAVDTRTVIREDVSWDAGTKTLCVRGWNICFSNYEHIYFVGLGKCAVDAGHEIESLLGDALTAGVVLDVQAGSFRKLRSLVGVHPFPTEQNLVATDEVVELLSRATERDLVIAVVSGGGSALLCAPHQIGHQALADITEALMHKGADIYELNTVRKHLSHVLGGNLAKIAFPATVVGLVFSDVLGDDLSAIASGPFVKDTTTAADAAAVLAKYDILNQCALPECEMLETPKEDQYFAKVSQFLLVSNERALSAMVREATQLGYSARIVDREIHGEAREVGARIAHTPLPPKTVMLYGGETTVTVSGTGGKGGRNQEVALGALSTIPPHTLLVAVASDGRDNSDHAGGIADQETLRQAAELTIDASAALATHRSYDFWSNTKQALLMGITGINVADIIIHMSE